MFTDLSMRQCADNQTAGLPLQPGSLWAEIHVHVCCAGAAACWAASWWWPPCWSRWRWGSLPAISLHSFSCICTHPQGHYACRAPEISGCTFLQLEVAMWLASREFSPHSNEVLSHYVMALPAGGASVTAGPWRRPGGGSGRRRLGPHLGDAAGAKSRHLRRHWRAGGLCHGPSGNR